MKLWVQIGDYPWWPATETTAVASDPATLRVVRFFGTYDLAEVPNTMCDTVAAFDENDSAKTSTDDPSLVSAIEEAAADAGEPVEVEYDAATVQAQILAAQEAAAAEAAAAAGDEDMDLAAMIAEQAGGDSRKKDKKEKKDKKDKKKEKKEKETTASKKSSGSKSKASSSFNSKVDEATQAVAAKMVEKQRERRKKEQDRHAMEAAEKGPVRAHVEDPTLDDMVTELSNPDLDATGVHAIFSRLTGARLTAAQLHRTGIAKTVAAIGAKFPGYRLQAAGLRQVWYADLSSDVKMTLQINRK